MTSNTSSMWIRVVLLAGVTVVVGAVPAVAQTAQARYTAAQAREAEARALIAEAATSTAPDARTRAMAASRQAIAAYEAVAARFPRSGYSDNALFNGASTAEALFAAFAEARDRQRAIALYRRVAAEYPTSSLVGQSEPAAARLERAVGPTRTAADATAAADADRARLTQIERVVLPGTVRITLSLDREVEFREESLAGPARVFFDLKRVEAAPELRDAVLRYPTDAVRQIRIGRHPDHTVRVVLDLEGVKRHSVYTLYNPFRVVVDCEPAQASAAAASLSTAVVPPAIATPAAMPAPPAPATVSVPPATTSGDALVPSAPTVTASGTSTAPATANANGAGGFSLSRQLGLGVSRIVIDPGHGGHDPGAQARGLNEADLTLDIALRLEALLAAEPGLEVVLTRRTNVFIPLEERTAIANREDADLFLSIHANASRNAAASGIETYYLSFASSPEAEAVAARENSAGARTMHHLPDIVKAITLNNKLDESRDLAGMVQEALVTRVRRSHKQVRNLGVKKAPFVVLIGAAMPSVLAEVSFLTNRQELQLLKTPAYKQRLAEALHAAVLRYRRSLKGQTTIAAQ